MFEIRLDVVVDLTLDPPPAAVFVDPFNLDKHFRQFAYHVGKLVRTSS